MAGNPSRPIDDHSRAQLLKCLQRDNRKPSDSFLSGVEDAVKVYRLRKDPEYLDHLARISRLSPELSGLVRKIPTTAILDFQARTSTFSFSQLTRDLPKLLDVLGKVTTEVIEDHSGKVHTTGRPTKDVERDFVFDVVAVFEDSYGGDTEDRRPDSEFRKDILNFVRVCMGCAEIQKIPGDARLYRDFIYPALS
jgi:hypothetical protein